MKLIFKRPAWKTARIHPEWVYWEIRKSDGKNVPYIDPNKREVGQEEIRKVKGKIKLSKKDIRSKIRGSKKLRQQYKSALREMKITRKGMIELKKIIGELKELSEKLKKEKPKRKKKKKIDNALIEKILKMDLQNIAEILVDYSKEDVEKIIKRFDKKDHEGIKEKLNEVRKELKQDHYVKKIILDNKEKKVFGALTLKYNSVNDNEKREIIKKFQKFKKGRILYNAAREWAVDRFNNIRNVDVGIEKEKYGILAENFKTFLSICPKYTGKAYRSIFITDDSFLKIDDSYNMNKISSFRKPSGIYSPWGEFLQDKKREILFSVKKEMYDVAIIQEFPIEKEVICNKSKFRIKNIRRNVIKDEVNPETLGKGKVTYIELEEVK